MIEVVEINSEYIQLDQFFKWHGITATGGQIKPLLEEELILVNGNIETAKRRKLFDGFVVELKGVGKWKISVAGE